MAAIKTLVYFDLEATGLKSSGRPRISELSFVAIDAQEINIMNKKLSEKVKNITCHEDILLVEIWGANLASPSLYLIWGRIFS